MRMHWIVVRIYSTWLVPARYHLEMGCMIHIMRHKSTKPFRLLHKLGCNGIPVLLALFLFGCDDSGADPAADLKLIQQAPAEDWQSECLPIGNGRLGAMPYGTVDAERIQFNEDTVWIGDEQDTGSYQAFGDLLIEFDASQQPVAFTDYQRELDIGNAIQTIEYQQNGIRYRREYFASHPANVLVFRLTADRPGAYSGTLSLKDAHKGTIGADGDEVFFSGTLSGKHSLSGKGGEPNNNIRLDYEARARVLHEGGSLTGGDGALHFENCDSLLILLDGGTDYVNQREQGWKGEHPHQRIMARLDQAVATSYDELRNRHIADYQSLFDRVRLHLGDSPEGAAAMSTRERLDAYRGMAMEKPKDWIGYEKKALNLAGGRADPGLEALIFQYARYLMIASSREGTLPANLQGIWNNSNNPPWRSDYHTDVNIQMNYWFTGPANLSDCFPPLAEWLWSVVPVKREPTREAFGARGWAHRAENGIFGGQTFKWYLGDAPWLLQNIWDHYAFTLDREYLETRAYPLIKEQCQFWEDVLIEWPNGKLVSPKSQSPEHGPMMEGNSYEQQLVYNLFTDYIKGSTLLDRDADYRAKIASMRECLLGPQIGSWGQLQEWAEDRDDPNDQHRHLSHLLAVHPLKQISPSTKPELAEAARVSLSARGDGGTGWSKAWKISMWARLYDGDRAHKLLREQIHGNFFSNLFSFHPPFQIDGNFGYAAGVCEMLLQSQTGVIHLLPALPAAWPSGEVKGLKARGAFEVDLAWTDGRLTGVRIQSLKGQPLSVQYGGHLIEALPTKAGRTYTFELHEGELSKL